MVVNATVDGVLRLSYKFKAVRTGSDWVGGVMGEAYSPRLNGQKPQPPVKFGTSEVLGQFSGEPE